MPGLPIREEFVGVAMTGRGGSGTDFAVEFLVAKLPNRNGCQGRALQARRPSGGRHRRSLTAVPVWKKRAQQELDGEVRSVALKWAKAGLSP